METLYEKVIIRSESDLPKDGTYFAYLRSANQVSLMIMSEDYKPFWIEDVEFYFRPYTPSKASAEEILNKSAIHLVVDGITWVTERRAVEAMHEFALQSREMPTDEEIEAQFQVTSTHQMDTDSWNNRLRQDGAKWLKSKLG